MMQALTIIVLLFFTQEGLALSTSKIVQTFIKTGDVHISKAVLLRQRILGETNETHCYKGIGCFPMEYPWTSLMRPLPAPHSPAYIQVQLYCYTRFDPMRRHTVILWPDIKLDNCPIRPGRKLAIITHGFLNNGNATWMATMKNSYLNAEDATVCLVDWGMGSERLNYLQAASNTRIVGAEIARFLKFVDTNYNVKPKNVHLIGHSLGAQISAYAAKRVPGIQRITALDPAQPGFEGCDKAVRLHKGDSDYVEVIHTNAAAFIPTFGFGMMEPIGDIDFYMNGGIRQPGCRTPRVNFKSIMDLASLTTEVLGLYVACSHGRAFEYFTQVLEKNCTIWGRKATVTHRIHLAGKTRGFVEPLVTPVVNTCDESTCIPIGLDTPNYNGRGIFIAETPYTSPFCTPQEEEEKIIREIKLSKLIKTRKELAEKGAAKEVNDEAVKIESHTRQQETSSHHSAVSITSSSFGDN